MVLNPVITKLAGRLVVLASASPRRREILTNVGLRFEVVPSWFKETLDKSSFAAPHLYAIETAKQKALEVARRMPFKHLKTPDIVIGADTIVTIEGDILEKPADKQDAYRMLSRLSGKEHSVFTGVAIVHCTSETDSQMEYDVFDFYEETKVKFADLSEELLWEYIHSGEPMDKAGGYGIQALGGMLVEYVHGDFLNVVGFPLNHFCKKLAEIYNPPPKSEIQHTKYESIPNVETFDNPGDLESGLERHMENGEAIRIGNQPGDQDNRSISHHCAAVSVEAKGPVEFPHNIADLLDGFKASKTLFVASKLKVFDLLNSHGGLKVGEVADKLQTSVVGTERLLDGCVALCLLEKTHQLDSLVYKNTEQANMYLVSSSEYSLHGYIIHCNDHVWPLFTHLEHAVQEGTNQKEKAFGSKTEDLFQDAYCNKKDVRLRFMIAMHSIARATGRDVAAVFDFSRFKTACDVGGCTGAMAYELVKMYPDLTITVYDLPAVIEMSNHFRPHKQDTHRVTFTAGDFFKDDLPKADLYILSRVLHDWSEDKIDVLLSKISQICSPGCGLLVALSGHPLYTYGFMLQNDPAPHICNWVSASGPCDKRFASSEELLAHLRTHTALPGADKLLAGYPGASCHLHLPSTSPGSPTALPGTFSLRSPHSLGLSRYHPYSKSHMPASGLPMHSLQTAPYYSPYALYSQRLTSASALGYQ